MPEPSPPRAPSKRIRLAGLVVVLALATALGACNDDDDGGGDPAAAADRLDPTQGPTDLRRAKAEAETFLSTVATGKSDDACASLAQTERDLLDESGGCELVASAVADEYKGRVMRVQLIEDTAVVSIRGRRNFRVELQRFDGEWQVTKSGL